MLDAQETENYLKEIKENEENKTIRKVLLFAYMASILITNFTTPIYAANDPVTVVNNFSDFMFGLIRAIGMILLGFGIVQVGLSLKSHDPPKSKWIYDCCWWNYYYVCERDFKYYCRLMYGWNHR